MANLNHSRLYNQVKPWLVFSTGTLFYCYEYLLRFLPNLMVRQISEQYHADPSNIWGILVYSYGTLIPIQFIAGLIFDIYDIKKPLLIATGLCAIGAFLFANGYSLILAKIGQSFVGAGAAFGFICALKLSANWLPIKYFSTLCGITTAAGMLMATLCEIYLNKLLNYYNWKWIFLTLSIIGFSLCTLIYVIIPKSNNIKRNKIKAINNLFLMKEKIKIVIKDKTIWIIGLIAMFFYLPTSIFAQLWGKNFLETVQFLSSQSAANAISILFFGWIIGGIIIGYIYDLTKAKFLILSLGAIVTLAILSLIIFTPLRKIYIFSLCFTLGISSSAKLLVFSISKEISNSENQSTYAAFLNTLMSSGALIFQPLVTKYITLSWRNIDKNSLIAIYQYKIAMSILPVALMVTLFLILLLSLNINRKKSYKN